MNKIFQKYFSVSAEYIKNALQCIKQNKKLFLIYFLFNLLDYGINLVIRLKYISNSFLFISLLFTYLNCVYFYILPLLIWKKEQKEKFEIKKIIKIFLKFSRKLFFPMLLIFIVLVSVVVFLDLTFHIKIFTTEDNHGIGFYPLLGLFMFFVGILSSLFIFSPFLYCFKYQSYFKSLKNSIFLSIKHKKFLFPLIVIYSAYNAICSVFIPSGNYILSFCQLTLSMIIFVIFYMSVYFYYAKHYEIEPYAILEKKKEAINVNIIYRRIFATILDLLFGIIIFLIAAVVTSQYIPQKEHTIFLNLYPEDIFFIAFFLFQSLYFILMEWLLKGTLGKKIMRINVVNEKGERITFFQSLIRNVFRLIDCFPFIIPYVLGLIFVASNDKKQRLGDKVAKTIVSK